MRRIVGILLCICLLVVCALVGWFGHKQLQSDASDAGAGNVSPVDAVSSEELLKKIPKGLDEFRLTNFYPGKRYVADDADDDGRWERVYVPVFDKPLKKIRRNYRAIVICFADVHDEVELRKRMQAESINVQYWPFSQKFNYETYNALAERYTSLDFDRSIIVYSGFPKGVGTAKYMFWGGSLGALLVLLAMGWQSVGLISIVIRKSAAAERANDDEDDEELEFMNRAGLPTIKRDQP